MPELVPPVYQIKEHLKAATKELDKYVDSAMDGPNYDLVRTKLEKALLLLEPVTEGDERYRAGYADGLEAGRRENK